MIKNKTATQQFIAMASLYLVVIVVVLDVIFSPTTKIVVAKHSIQANTTITAESLNNDFEEVIVASNIIKKADYMHSKQELKKLIDSKVTLSKEIAEGEYILDTDFKNN